MPHAWHLKQVSYYGSGYHSSHTFEYEDEHQAVEAKEIEKFCLSLKSNLQMLLFRQKYNLSTEQDAKNIFEEFDEVFNRPESIVNKTHHTDTDPIMLPKEQTSHIVQSH